MVGQQDGLPPQTHILLNLLNTILHQSLPAMNRFYHLRKCCSCNKRRRLSAVVILKKNGATINITLGANHLPKSRTLQFGRIGGTLWSKNLFYEVSPFCAKVTLMSVIVYTGTAKEKKKQKEGDDTITVILSCFACTANLWKLNVLLLPY